MAVYAPAKCNKCGTEFTISGGDGFYFSIFKCEDCGHRKVISHPDQRAYMIKLTAEQIGKCEKCGGTLSKYAPNRCPKCSSLDYTVDNDNRYALD